jgi:hypothetical protein
MPFVFKYGESGLGLFAVLKVVAGPVRPESTGLVELPGLDPSDNIRPRNSGGTAEPRALLK